jgi:hypothetical protein
MTPMYPCQLTATVAHESVGILTLAGIGGFRVHARRSGSELHLRVLHGTRVVGEAVARAAHDDNDPVVDLWGCEIRLDGCVWQVSGVVGSGVLAFSAPRVARTLA